MKAILVIDLNDTTLNEWDTDTSKCWAEIKVHTPIKGGTHGIGCVYANDNVELKPMPQKEDINEKLEICCSDDELDIRVAHARGYQYGWNDCIREILGEEE